MYKSIIVTALAAAAAAMPAPQTVSPRSGEFALAAKFDATVVSLTAVQNGTSADRVLVAGRLAAFPGTPVYTYINAKGTAIDSNIDGATYGLIVTPVGNSYGSTTTVVAKKDAQDYGWVVNNGAVYHQTQAAFNFFYLCQATVNGAEADVLKWGDANSNTTAPSGCTRVDIVQNCNVAGSNYKC